MDIEYRRIKILAEKIFAFISPSPGYNISNEAFEEINVTVFNAEYIHLEQKPS